MSELFLPSIVIMYNDYYICHFKFKGGDLSYKFLNMMMIRFGKVTGENFILM